MFNTHVPAAVPFIFVSVALSGCMNDLEDAGDAMGVAGYVDDSTAEKAMSNTCAAGSTVKGIDVSYYQGNINWTSVKNDGVQFAFIRVSDGVTFNDPKFAQNWAGAKAAGVRRGAYQFFRPNQSATEQADLMIAKIGQLQPGDLPPVIDVEATGGQSQATIKTKITTWVNRVEAALGVKPIIYTGPYFWRDQVGGPDFDAHHLWVAHYGTSCPLVPPTWTRWSFHQHTDSGSVAGISGNVDMNKFNGTASQLAQLGFGASTAPPPPPANACNALGAQGGVIDDGDACFVAGGNAQWLHKVNNRGHNGDLVYTGTTASASTENFAEWTVKLAEAGTYELEVFIDDVRGTSRQAKYKITHADGTTDAVINQNSSSGFVSLGAYSFGTSGGKVRLNDNTGEAGSLNRDIVLDGMRVTRLDDTVPDQCGELEVFGTGSVLNVRPDPNTNRAPVGTLQDGDVVTRLSTVTGAAVQGNTTWHRITNGSITGFVTDVYVRCAE